MVKVDFKFHRNDFSFQIDETFTSEITGIYGPSGAGKTTLLKSIAGLIKPKSGTISIDDEMLFESVNGVHIPVEQRRIGYVFQEGRLFPHLTVEQNLKYGLKLDGSPIINFDEVVELLELQLLLSKKPNQLSGGEQQRTAIGRALLSSPRILLLDEPFSGLDHILKKQLVFYLMKLQQKIQLQMIVVSHSLSDLLRMTNHLCVIEKGRSLGTGHFFELIKDVSVFKYLDSNEFLNAIDVYVNEQQELVWNNKNTQNLNVFKGITSNTLPVNTSLKLYIKPNEVSLSLEPLNQITIQNQVKGVVKEFVENDNSVFVLVDVGFVLLVEITQNAKLQLSLKEGLEVWCLFKSVATEIIGS